jgi:hypothetical protein
MFDPIGPGTPAWYAFDRAMDLWKAYRAAPSGSPKRKAYKDYHNARHYMKQCLARAGHSNDFDSWAKSLREQRDEA